MSEGLSTTPEQNGGNVPYERAHERSVSPQEAQDQKINDLTEKINASTSVDTLRDIEQEIRDILRIAEETRARYDQFNGHGSEHISDEYLRTLRDLLQNLVGKVEGQKGIEHTDSNITETQLGTLTAPEEIKEYIEILLAKQNDLNTKNQGDQQIGDIANTILQAVKKLGIPTKSQDGYKQAEYLLSARSLIDESTQADISTSIETYRQEFLSISHQLAKKEGEQELAGKPAFDASKFQEDSTYQIESLKKLTTFDTLEKKDQIALLNAINMADLGEIVLRDDEVGDAWRAAIELLANKNAPLYSSNTSDESRLFSMVLVHAQQAYNKLFEQNFSRLQDWESLNQGFLEQDLARARVQYADTIAQASDSLPDDPKWTLTTEKLQQRLTEALSSVPEQDRALVTASMIPGLISNKRDSLSRRQNMIGLGGQAGVSSYTEQFTGYTARGEQVSTASSLQSDTTKGDDSKNEYEALTKEGSVEPSRQIEQMNTGSSLELNGSTIKKLGPNDYRVNETKARNPEQVETLVELNMALHRLGLSSLAGRPETLNLVRITLSTLHSQNTPNIPRFDAPNFVEFSDDVALVLLETISGEGNIDNNLSIEDRSLSLSRELKSKTPNGDRPYLISLGLIRNDGSIDTSKFGWLLSEKLRGGYRPKFRENEPKPTTEASIT